LFDLAWANALPAADFESLLVLPSRKTFDAAFDACGEVASFGALLCVSALAAAVLEAFPVERFCKVFDAAEAAFLPVTFAMLIPPGWFGIEP
jgi:hypothetical protein